MIEQKDMTTTNITTIAADEEASIRALEDKFVAAFNKGNIDAMMKK